MFASPADAKLTIPNGFPWSQHTTLNSEDGRIDKRNYVRVCGGRSQLSASRDFWRSDSALGKGDGSSTSGYIRSPTSRILVANYVVCLLRMEAGLVLILKFSVMHRAICEIFLWLLSAKLIIIGLVLVSLLAYPY